MAAGTSTYMGLAVPLYGEFELTQQTGATDFLTLTGGNGQTGDFIVARDSTETERFVVEDGGNPVITQKAAGDIGLKIVRASTPTTHGFQITTNDGTTNRFAVTLRGGMLLRSFTTRPTTGLTKNELLLLYHGSTPKLGVCSSTAAQTIKLIRLRTKTFGRLTA
jgi:hypothetical protein